MAAIPRAYAAEVVSNLRQLRADVVANKSVRFADHYERGNLEELGQNTTLEARAGELADQVYLQELLQCGKDAQTADVLPESCTKNLKAVAERA